jgi:PAS domain S-box-containing protein
MSGTPSSVDCGLLREVVTATPEGLLTTDGEGTVVFANRAVEAELGYERGELIGLDVETVVPSVGRSILATPGAEGEPPPEEAGLVELADASGDRCRVPGRVVETDYEGERYRTLRLRLSDLDASTTDRFERIFEHANDAILLLDPERQAIVDCNPSACELFGYSREQLMNVSTAAVHPEEMDRFREFLDGVMAEGAGWTGELDCYTADGNLVPTEISASRLLVDGRPHVLALIRDLSERHDREQELRRRSAAMEATAEGMAILDDRERYQYVNDAHASIYGHDRDAVLGDTWHRFYDDEERHRLETTMLSAVRADGQWTGEAVGQRTDGTTFPQLLTVTELADGGMVYAVRDITERQAYVDGLEALNEASGALMTAESPTAIAERAVETVESVLGYGIACIRLLDTDESQFDLVAMTDRAEGLLEASPGFDLDSSAAGRAFRRAEVVETEVEGDDPPFDGHAGVATHLPLGEYGTLTVFAPSAALPELAFHQLELLAASVGAALERSEREATHRQQERELRARYAELNSLNSINTLLQDLIQGLMAATTRTEIYETVCDRLAASELYDSAWIASGEVVDGGVSVLAAAGIDEETLETLERLPLEYLAYGTVADALRTETVHTVRQYQVTDEEADTAAPQATEVPELASEAVAAVPLVNEDRVHGVLVVNAASEDAFGENVRAGLDRLGSAVGFALGAALNRELLLSDTVVRLEFRTTDTDCLPVAFSARLDCFCRLELFTPTGNGDRLVYLRFEGTTPDAALEVAEELSGVGDCRIASEHDGQFLLELTVAEGVTAIPTLLAVGAVVPDVTGEDGVGRIVVETAPSANVRELVERLREQFDDAELISKHELDRSVRTAAEFRDRLRDGLTEKQLLAIETAHVVGYYEWPRETSAKELAASLGISAPTLHQHLRKAEQKLVTAFFDDASQAAE